MFWQRKKTVCYINFIIFSINMISEVMKPGVVVIKNQKFESWLEQNSSTIRDSGCF